MVAAIAAQAGLVQVLGALSDKMRFVTKLEMQLVGEVETIDEGALKTRLARDLRVSVSSISLSARPSATQDVAAKASETTNAFKSPEQRVRDRLLERIGANRAVVNDVTATVTTSNVAVSKAILVNLKSHTPRTISSVLGSSLGNSVLVNAVSATQTSEVEQTGVRRRLLAYAQFWQRMGDQNMTLLIFVVLLVLSVLPILQLQTIVLFNRAFAAILQRKIHRQELLDDLYTPGIFYEVEAEEPTKQGSSALGRTMRGARRGAAKALRRRAPPAPSSAAPTLSPAKDQRRPSQRPVVEI